jgi:hypothetical protein
MVFPFIFVFVIGVTYLCGVEVGASVGSYARSSQDPRIDMARDLLENLLVARVD